MNNFLLLLEENIQNLTLHFIEKLEFYQRADTVTSYFHLHLFSFDIFYLILSDNKYSRRQWQHPYQPWWFSSGVDSGDRSDLVTGSFRIYQVRQLREKRKIINLLNFRTAKVAIPATSAGQKVPVVIHLHGNCVEHRNTVNLIKFNS